MHEEEGNKTGKNLGWEGPNVLGGEWRDLGDKGEGVCWAAVKASEWGDEEGKKTAEGLEKPDTGSHLVRVYILKIIFHTPNLTSKGKWASERIRILKSSRAMGPIANPGGPHKGNIWVMKKS